MDVGEEVVTRSNSMPALRGFVASSTVKIAFGAFMIISPVPNESTSLSYISTPHAVIETVRVDRPVAKKVPSRRSPSADGTDTNVGMSTGRLAKYFLGFLSLHPMRKPKINRFFLG